MISIKRAYEPPDISDGHRFLIDRLWPRGIPRTELRIEAWLRDLAPSNALRRAFGHEPAKWSEFRKAYLAELRAVPPGVQQLLEAARTGPVTLVYGARDERHNNAVVVREYLNRRIRPATRSSRSRSGGG
ncbi:MAG: DUF488 domain-containing protein [Gemmatimonadales bacterium]